MTHYTGVLIIEKVEEAEPAEHDQYGKLKTPAKQRHTSEVAKITVRATAVDKLAEKLVAHVNLVEPA